MQTTLGWVLLVDDDKDCNFFHQRIITNARCTNQINVASDGGEALEIIRAKNGASLTERGIIFLDINMPGLNGWDFLDEYLKFDMDVQQHILIMMLTTSLNPDDKQRALGYKCVNAFLNKPLTGNAFNSILAEHFPQSITRDLPISSGALR